MQITEVFKALSDESRLRLLNAISHGAFNVQELTSIIDLGQSTISHHLKVLQSCGLVRSQREGTWIYYSLVSADSPTPPIKAANSFFELAQTQELDSTLRSALTKDNKEISRILNKRRDQTRSFFENNAHNWSEMRIDLQDDEKLMQKVIEHIDPNSDLLELGCGTGALLKRILPRKGQSIGVDYSQAMLDEAKQNLSKYMDNLDLRLGNLEHLPLRDGSIDTAVAYMVMHHIARPIDVITETLRVLKPGAQFVVVDLTQHDKEYMRERLADLWLGFETKEFKKWVSQVGFSDITLETLGSNNQAFILTCRKPKK